MPNPPRAHQPVEAFVDERAGCIVTVVHQRRAWMTETTPDLQQVEEHVLHAHKELGRCCSLGSRRTC